MCVQTIVEHASTCSKASTKSLVMSQLSNIDEQKFEIHCLKIFDQRTFEGTVDDRIN